MYIHINIINNIHTNIKTNIHTNINTNIGLYNILNNTHTY